MTTKLDKKPKKRENAQAIAKGGKKAKLKSPAVSTKSPGDADVAVAAKPKPEVKIAVNGGAKKQRFTKKLVPATNGDAESDTDNEAEPAAAAAAGDGKLGSNINKSIFGIFKRLQTKQLTQKHINELISLLKDEADAAKRTATCAYALKRLVRCTGADDKQAVALNASYIHGILRTVPGIDHLELLQNMKKDLPVGSQLKGKEESLAAVGQIVTAYCIMQTEEFQSAAPALIVAIYQILLAQLRGEQREYLVTLSAQIMADSFKQLSARSFEANVWPLLQPLLTKSSTHKKLPTLDLLLAVHLSYPLVLPRNKLNFDKQHFDLYLGNSLGHSDGAFERLAKLLASDAALLQAWQQRLDAEPLKLSAAKSCAIKVLSYVLLNYKEEEQKEQPLLSLFSDAFLAMLLTELTAAKQLKSNVKASQLHMRATCRAFEASLQLSFEKVLKSDASKLGILRCLLKAQLQLDQVVQTPRFTQQLIQQLSADGLKQLYTLYSDILTAAEEEQTTKAMREHCLNQLQLILQSPLLEEDAKWRRTQLKFLLLAGLFHLDAEQQPCVAAQAAPFSRQTANRCEEIFFACLLRKCSDGDLTSLCQLLRQHIKTLAKELEGKKKSGAEQQTLRAPWEAAAQKAWKEHVQQTLQSPSEEKDALGQAFDALILFLGLTLLTRSSGVPVAVLEDLVICRQRAKDEQAGKPNKNADELSWQDVLTDALLQLLLQTGNFWRQFVNAIGAALVTHLKKENLEQLLQILDMTKNPLKEGQLGDEEQEEDSESEEEEASDSEEESESEEEEEAAEEEGEEDDEESRLAQIRESVRSALADDEDGASSVDWNDVDDEQGQRLNAALESAFQAFRPKSKSGSKKDQQQTKSERISSTSLLHFRIRVLDLVELFVVKQPQLEHLLDALSTVYYVYKFSSGDSKLQSLSEASKKLLRKLLQQKIAFKSKQQEKLAIIDCIEQFMAPPEQPLLTPKPASDVAEWRDKCVAYLVSQFPADDKAAPIWPLLERYVSEWVAQRNCPHSLASFEALLNAQWLGVAQLAACFARHLPTARSFRRAQIIGLLVKQQRHLAAAFAANKKAAAQYEKNIAKYAESQLEESEQKATPKERQLLGKLLGQGGEEWKKLQGQLAAAKTKSKSK